MNDNPETLTEEEEKLKHFLNDLLQHADTTSYVSSDPLGIVRRFAPVDQPVVGLLVSSLAYGRVTSIRKAANGLLARLGNSPKQTIIAMDWDELQDYCHGFVYRMTKAEDIADLLWGIREVLHQHQTLEALYISTPGDHLTRAAAFVDAIKAARHREEQSRGLGYLLPSPAAGSATKRLHLYFRWMIRDADGVDLGLWESVSPAGLLLPLDTHTSRICRYLGLSERMSVDLKMAKQVTEKLQRFDPDDPTRFDFAICHLGISGGCQHKRSEPHCSECPLEPVCQLE